MRSAGIDPVPVEAPLAQHDDVNGAARVISDVGDPVVPVGEVLHGRQLL